MKKFLVAVLVVAMVSMMGLVAFAAPLNNQVITAAKANVEAGTVQLTYDLSTVGSVVWTELTILTAKPDMKTDGTDQFGNFYGADKGMLTRLDLKNPEGGVDNSNNQCLGGALIGPKGTADANYYYDFEAGKTYYFVIMTCDGANWNYSTSVYELKFAESEAPAPTADVSTIAFAVASVLGCGALAVRKKR